MKKTFEEMLKEDPSLLAKVQQFPMLHLCPVEIKQQTYKNVTGMDELNKRFRIKKGIQKKYEGKKVTIH